MASKVISISLPEALEWKLSQLNHRTGIPRSVLVARGLLLLIGEIGGFQFSGGSSGEDWSLEDVEEEYSAREGSHGATVETDS